MLANLFNPKSIAIIGASQTEGKVGYALVKNLLDAEFKGQIYPVNPKYNELQIDQHKIKSYKSVLEINAEIDIACIAIPAKFVMNVVEEIVQCNVKNVVIVSAGFREIGKEGRQIEEQIKNRLTKKGIRILGPNCLGLAVPRSNLNLSFAADNPEDGNIAFLSQSGAICTALLDMAMENGLGFSHFLSIGNKVDLNELDLIRNFEYDPSVKVIGMYLEEIEDGQELIKLGYKTTKPIVIFKPGKSESSKKAIESHTGSLAGSAKIIETGLSQAGIIEVERIDEMYQILKLLSYTNLPAGKRVSVITNAGGPGIIITDDIEKYGLELSSLSEQTKTHLTQILPPTSHATNPIDLIGDSDAERYRKALELLTNDDKTDIICLILTPQFVTEIEKTAEIIPEYKTHPAQHPLGHPSPSYIKISEDRLEGTLEKLIIPIFVGGERVKTGIKIFNENNVPVFRNLESAIKVVNLAYEYKQKQEFNSKNDRFELFNVKNESKNFNISEGKSSKTRLDENKVEQLFCDFDIALPKQILTNDIGIAENFALQNFPVVIKASTKDIVHKTDEDFVKLNIKNSYQLRYEFSNIQKLVAENTNQQSPELIIQKQITGGEEIFIGAIRDGNPKVYEDEVPGFGHLVTFGKGGIYTEIYKDLEYLLVPYSEHDVRSALEKIKISQIINGARGQQPLAKEKLIQLILKLQNLLICYPEIESLDLNPVILTEEDVYLVDTKVFINY